jgi:hypothetical protein
MVTFWDSGGADSDLFAGQHFTRAQEQHFSLQQWAVHEKRLKKGMVGC